MIRIWLMSQLRQPPNVLLMTLKEAKVLPQFTEIEWLPHVSFLALAVSSYCLALCSPWLWSK